MPIKKIIKMLEKIESNLITRARIAWKTDRAEYLQLCGASHQIHALITYFRMFHTED